jgi:hypothetical protein
MNTFLRYISSFYSQILHLYPRSFRDEFAEEMQVVFRDSLNEAVRDGILSLALVCLRELGGLPIHILREFLHEFERKEMIMVTEKANTKSTVGKGITRWDAVLGTLPFALFGLLCMLIKIELPIHVGYPFLAFSAISVLGLIVGLAKGFPRWAYSYLGWSILMSWWWMMMPIDTFSNPSPLTHNQYLGWWAWIPLLAAIGLGVLFARSFRPIRRLAGGIWQDWTYLSLMIYSFVAFVQLIYDEIHHPYLFAFMAASTLVICWAVWVFLQSASSWKRLIVLLAGFFVSLVLNNISYVTWDYAAYYGLPPSPPQPWYTAFNGVIGWTIFWSGIMFWPLLIGLVRRVVNSLGKPGVA